ncbi:MAG: DUF1134 domain-containing protein [Pseudomonadota bacterium]
MPMSFKRLRGIAQMSLCSLAAAVFITGASALAGVGAVDSAQAADASGDLKSPLVRVNDPYSPRSGRVEGDRWVPDGERETRRETYRDERVYRERRDADRDLRRDRGERYARDRYDNDLRDERPVKPSPRYGRNYERSAPDRRASAYDRYERAPRRRYAEPRDEGYSESEIVSAGHRFFGSVSQGLAKAIQRLFKRSGKPNGYILGEDAGGAFVAGLRYGEGRLYTKHLGDHPVYWQGPSVGYDFGGEGSKVMVLVYNLRRPSDVYKRYGGVEGSAYVVGGVSVQLQKNAHVTMAPIRAGVGLRLGANVGYLKYTRRPTWNPF